MNKRVFGRTGREVGEIGLGCWQLGGTDWGGLSDLRAHSILLAAMDSGVTFFDTADVYGAGKSEEIIGKFVKERKEKEGRPFVATKIGRAQGIYPDGYTREALQSAVEASLRRLGVEALDLAQLHCVPTSVLESGEVFGWLRDMKGDGKIRDFGASVETVEEALLCLKQPGLASLQVIFSLFRQKPAFELFPLALSQGVAIIVRLPLASGLLGGHMTGQTVFAPTDHRSYNRNGQAFNVGETFCGLTFEDGLDLVSRVQRFLPSGVTLPQFALRFILDHPAVSVVIPGSSRPTQTTANAVATKLPRLSPELHEQIRAFYESEVAARIRGPY
jgi:aryl-alcohol dehydrogenase-like predicted oxidoreductase